MKQIGIGIVIVVLALVIPVAGYWLGGERSLEELRPMIERELSEVLDLPVTIAGPISVKFTPRPHLSAEDVRIANLPGRPSPSLLTVGRLSLATRILPLFRNMLVIDALRMEDAKLRIEQDEDGNWRVLPRLDQLEEDVDPAPGDPIALSVRRLQIRNMEIFFNRPGEEQGTSLEIREVNVTSKSVGDPLILELEGAFEGSAFSIEARTGSLTAFVEDAEMFPIDLRARLPHSSIDAKGTLGKPSSFAGMHLPFEAEVTDAAIRFWNVPIPPLGPFAFSGTLVAPDGVVGIDDVSLRSNHGGGIELELKGSVRDLARAEGVELRLSARAPDADLFRNLSSLTLPDVPVRVDLDLDDGDGSLGVEGALELAAPGVFEMLAEGDFDDLRRRKDLDLRFGLEAKDLEAFSTAITQRISRKFPALGPVKAAGQLVLDDEGFGIRAIDITIGDKSDIWLHATGSVGDLVGMRDVAIEARVTAASARRLAAFYDREIPVKTKRVLGLINPILTFTIGGMLMFVILAVMMPLYGMYQQIGTSY